MKSDNKANAPIYLAIIYFITFTIPGLFQSF